MIRQCELVCQPQSSLLSGGGFAVSQARTRPGCMDEWFQGVVTAAPRR